MSESNDCECGHCKPKGIKSAISFFIGTIVVSSTVSLRIMFLALAIAFGWNVLTDIRDINFLEAAAASIVVYFYCVVKLRVSPDDVDVIIASTLLSAIAASAIQSVIL